MMEFLSDILEVVKSFFLMFTPVLDFIDSTKVPEQIENVQYRELFTNFWFLVPYLGMVGWNIYKKQINTLVIIALFTASWAFFGTDYMREVMNQDQLSLEAILPLLAGACTVMGIIVYLIFFKSE